MEGRDYRDEAARRRVEKRRSLDKDRLGAFQKALGDGPVKVKTADFDSVAAAKAGARAHREAELETILGEAKIKDAQKAQKWTDAEVVDQT